MSECVRDVLDRYFDFDANPWQDHDAACPAPEDIWRLHRDLKAAIAADKPNVALLDLVRAHIPRNRYDDEGAPAGTYCICGEWTGDYFADGEAGPFDEHLAAMVGAWTDARYQAAEDPGRRLGWSEAWDGPYCSKCGRHQDWVGDTLPGAPCMGCGQYPAALRTREMQ